TVRHRAFPSAAGGGLYSLRPTTACSARFGLDPAPIPAIFAAVGDVMRLYGFVPIPGGNAHRRPDARDGGAGAADHCLCASSATWTAAVVAAVGPQGPDLAFRRGVEVCCGQRSALPLAGGDRNRGQGGERRPATVRQGDTEDARSRPGYDTRCAELAGQVLL